MNKEGTSVNYIFYFRRTTFSFVAKIVDEIPISEFNGYIGASFGESYEYIVQNSI